MEETKKDYLAKIKEIEGYVDSGRSVGFGTFVKSTILNRHLNELKNIIEEQLLHANSILEQEQTIIRQARLQAKEIVESAKDEVMNQDIAQQAENYARDLVLKAQEEAKEKIKNASDLRQKMLINSHKYLENLFTEMEQQLLEQRQIISDNRDEIRDSLQKKIDLMDGLPS